MKLKKQEISVREFAQNHNPRLNRRGHKMSEGYIYRLIRQDKNEGKNGLWFEYKLIGEKERIVILIN